jgi:YetA-like protein
MFCASIEDLSTARDETRVVRIGCPDSWPRYKRAAIVEVITGLASRGARIMRAPGRAQHFGRLRPRGCPLGWCATLLWLVACAATSKDAAATAPTLFPRPLVELHRHPGSTSVKSWPVTFGVPFRPGALAADTPLGVVDSLGARVPAQVEPVATWPDGSVRWLRVSFVQSFASKLRYYLAVTAPATPMTDDIVITSSRGTVLLSTGPAQFEISNRGFLDRIWLDQNGDGIFEPEEVLSDAAGDGFYVEMTDGRRGVLTNATLSIEAPVRGTIGPVRYAVLKMQGQYLDQQTRVPLAEGTVYYHFYGGERRFRIDHKLIITEHNAGFTEIGLRLPLSIRSGALATVEDTFGKAFPGALAAAS